MSDILQDALMRGLATEVLEQLPTEYPILNGDVIALSNYGKNMWDDAISWTNSSMVANFIPTQNAPFSPSNYGTVAIVEEPKPLLIPIITEACKVSFNHKYYKKMVQNGTIIDYYRQQLIAKVQAWDATLNNIILYGNPSTATPGLLTGSGIPLISSSVDLKGAPSEAVINEIIRIATTPSNNSNNIFKPSKIALPQDLWNILNRRSYSTQIADTLLKVILDRLNTSAGYNRPEDPKFTVVAVPQFNSNQLMTVLPTDPDQIGAAVYDLEEFDSPDNSEPAGTQLASSHTGGYAGVICKRPGSGVIATLTY